MKSKANEHVQISHSFMAIFVFSLDPTGMILFVQSFLFSACEYTNNIFPFHISSLNLNYHFVQTPRAFFFIYLFGTQA